MDSIPICVKFSNFYISVKKKKKKKKKNLFYVILFATYYLCGVGLLAVAVIKCEMLSKKRGLLSPILFQDFRICVVNNTRV